MYMTWLEDVLRLIVFSQDTTVLLLQIEKSVELD